MSKKRGTQPRPGIGVPLPHLLARTRSTVAAWGPGLTRLPQSRAYMAISSQPTQRASVIGTQSHLQIFPRAWHSMVRLASLRRTPSALELCRIRAPRRSHVVARPFAHKRLAARSSTSVEACLQAEGGKTRIIRKHVGRFAGGQAEGGCPDLRISLDAAR